MGRLARRIRRAARSATPGSRRWRKSALDLYSQFLGSGDLVFDVGANVGNRIDVFLALGARVVAIEPQAICVSRLQARFDKNPNVSIVPKALGRAAGTAELMVSEADTISSMSSHWVDAVRSSGRFASYQWNERETVVVTSLDTLIGEFGRPAFCKIDVEGFELEVLSGLSSPVPALSFEFTPEVLDTALASVDRLSSLGAAEFNYSLGESMRLQLPRWTNADNLKSILRGGDVKQFGDVYARFAQAVAV